MRTFSIQRPLLSFLTILMSVLFITPVVFGQTGTTNPEILGQNEAATLSAVGTVCPQLATLSREGTLTSGQLDLFTRCGEVLQASDLGLRNIALDQMGREEASVTGSTITETTRVQLVNIQRRITTLRAMGIADAGGAAGGAMELAENAPYGLSNQRPGQAFARPMVAGGQSGSSGGGGGKYGWFVNGEFSTAERDKTALEDGFDYDGYDVTIGFDSAVGSSSFFGVAAGIKRAEADLLNEDSDFEAEGYSLSLYGGSGSDGLFFDYTVGYAQNSFETNTAINYTIEEKNSVVPRGFTNVNQIAFGDTDGDEILASATIGYSAGSGSFNFQPFIQGTFTDTSIDGYEEQMLNPGNGSGLALRVEDQDIESMIGAVGATLSWNLSTSFGVVVPTVRAEWQHEFNDDARVIRTRFVNEANNPANDDDKNLRVFTDSPDDEFYSVSAGLNFVFVGGTQFYLLYNTILELDDIDYQGATIGIRFEI